MCGIIGAVGNHSIEAHIKKLNKCLYELKHRGPDNQEYIDWERAWFGHTRLSIVDISNGNQPMISRSGNSMIVYNGEVYNYVEVAKRYEISSSLKTNCDTEVILEIIDKYGYEAIRFCVGMFAVGVYNKHKSELVLIRDPIGVKPLYYTFKNDILFFASELKIVKALLDTIEYDMDALISYFKYSYIPEPRTVYKNIYALEPGHYLVFNKGGIEIKEYWRPRLGNRFNSNTYNNDSIAHAIKRSITSSLISDVPISCLYSGGIDSAVLGSIIKDDAEYYNLRIKDLYDESELAKYTSTTLGINISIINGNITNGLDVINRIQKHIGQPFGDTSMKVAYIIFNKIAQKYKVCLSGDGADEVFCGYILRRATLLNNLITEKMLRKGKMNRVIKEVIVKIITRYLNNTKINLNEWIKESILKNYNDYHASNVYREVEWGLGETDDILNIVSWILIKYNLPNDMLVKVDRTSMMNSLEVRVPFLNHDVVEQGLLMSGKTKQDMMTTKIILREMLKKSGISKKYLNKPKIGFGPRPQNWSYLFKGMPKQEGIINDMINVRDENMKRENIYYLLADNWERINESGGGDAE